MITFTEFLDKWNGKYCEMGGSANAINQCVDLANAWIAEYGEPIVLWTNAQDFPNKISKNFKWILNTPTGVPKQGDIIVWKSPDNIGHIAICSSATASKFVSFDQNWPVGSVCKLVNHIYTGTYEVMGWLRYEKQIDYPALIKEKDEQIQTLQEKVLSLDNFVNEIKDRVVVLERELESSRKQAEDWQSDFVTANKQLENKIEELETMTAQKNQYKSWYEKALETIPNKMTGWKLIAEGIKKLFIHK